LPFVLPNATLLRWTLKTPGAYLDFPDFFMVPWDLGRTIGMGLLGGVVVV